PTRQRPEIERQDRRQIRWRPPEDTRHGLTAVQGAATWATTARRSPGRPPGAPGRPPGDGDRAGEPWGQRDGGTRRAEGSGGPHRANGGPGRRRNAGASWLLDPRVDPVLALRDLVHEVGVCRQPLRLSDRLPHGAHLLDRGQIAPALRVA